MLPGGPGGAGALAEFVTGGCNLDPEADVGGEDSPSDIVKNQSETLTKFRLIVNLDNNKPNAIS